MCRHSLYNVYTSYIYTYVHININIIHIYHSYKYMCIIYISTCVFIHFHPFSAGHVFYQNISSLQKITASSAPLNATPVLRYWKMHCCHHPRARRLGHWDLHAWRFLRDNDEDFSGKPNGRNGIFPRFQKEIHFQAF